MVSTNIKSNIAQWLSATAFVLVAVFALMGVTACSENEDDTEEFANWKSVNDAHWTNLYNTTKQKIANGDTSWSIELAFPYDKQSSTTGGTLAYSPDKYIIIHKLENGTGSGMPLYTDSVHVHYEGRLLPSATYTAGFVFDKTWAGKAYDATSSLPGKMYVKKVVTGFATALQKMHIGDHWIVYIPYQLAYGQTEHGKVPAYSNLIFDLRLQAYFRE